MSRAFELLNAELAAGKTKQRIADEIGYSRSAVSLYLNGKYERNVAAIEAAVVRVYDVMMCPHINETVRIDLCRRKALGPKPFGGTARLEWRLCCQTCPHRPAEPEKHHEN